MADRLRLLWNRPLQDHDRVRLFAIAVALIAGTAAVLTQLDRPDSASRSKRPPNAPPAAALAPTTPAPSSTPPKLSSEPAEEGTRTVVPASRADVASSRRAARRFVAGYLPYTYGTARAREIRSATGSLRRRLAAQRPRVPAREQRRRPRLVLLQSDAVGRRHAQFVALIEDGSRRYTVALALKRTRAGWQVNRAGS